MKCWSQAATASRKALPLDTLWSIRHESRIDYKLLLPLTTLR